MSVGTAVGPFRGLVPFDETSAESFFGRVQEADALLGVVLAEGHRVSALSGEAGVGKTSLIRSSLAPALAKRGVLPIVLGGYHDLDAEIVRATGRSGADPPSPGESSADYLTRIARGSRGGTVIVLDHLEEALADEAGAAADLGALLARVAEGAGPRLRFLLCVESGAFHRLDRLQAASGLSPAPGAWMTLERLGAEQVTEILERTALQSGIFFESGLSAVVAADLCRSKRCLPLDLQLVARVILDLRLTSQRKYQRSGGAAILRNLFFERLCAEAGGQAALRVILELADAGEAHAEELERRTRLGRAKVEEALSAFVARGVLRLRRTARGDLYSLAHDRLREGLGEFAAEERARAEAARRVLRRRVMAGERLTVRQMLAVRRHLGAALSPDEEALLLRSLRRKLFQIGVGAFIAVGVLIAVFLDLRRSYTLGFDPADGRAAARVVVRIGRPSLSFLYFLPNRPRFGSILADTGFSAAGMASETAARISSGRAAGTLDGGGQSGAAVPGWLKEVLNGLRPVPRGVAKALLGDPGGVTSLKHAFTDPLARRETLEALAVIGRGRAGEDEILTEALADKAPEIRRRGVEVAAAISRRQGGPSHVAILRSALADTSPEVRGTVLREAATLAPDDAASILATALADRDPAFRRSAEEAILALGERSPGAAADAVRQVVGSPDAAARRGALALLERIAAKNPAESAAALVRLVADEKTAEEARVTALVALRRAGPPSAELTPVLEKAVRPEASPRLRSAALPLYARLIDPARAEEIAREQMKGPTAARAAGAAVWGTVAMKRPDVAVQPLKSLLYDPNAETRIEATRSLAWLKKDGIPLVEKAIKDGNPEVQRAAIESAVALAPVNPYAVADLLGRTVKNVRPAVRKTLIESLGRMGETRPAAVISPLAKALKEKDAGTRVAAAAAFCVIARKNAAAASPYLRIAARDDDHDVRAAAASCLADLAQGDPRGAAKLAAELASAGEPQVRAAAAESLGRLGGKARDTALATLMKLLGDPERVVRVAAERSIASLADGEPGGGLGKRAGEAERALASALAQGDPEEGRLVVAAAARNGLVTILRQATANGDDGVRLEAVRAAGALRPPALEVISPAVDDRSNLVRAEAMRLLAGAAGAGSREVLPVFEAMLRGGDAAAREAAVIAIGDLGGAGAGEAAARLLGEVLSQRSESIRATAARALGRLAEREPDQALPHLERALEDPSYDVKTAAIPGLALAWSKKKTPAELARLLVESEADSARRFVALEALVTLAQQPAQKAAAEQALAEVADKGPPLARLAAQIGRGFSGAKPAEVHAFLERLLGG